MGWPQLHKTPEAKLEANRAKSAWSYQKWVSSFLPDIKLKFKSTGGKNTYGNLKSMWYSEYN